ncbi:hypothetical protein PV403_22040 [Paenibacillus sp. GYB006]|uniref:hypothetical protein n=1 Tax=Paenibacillus sp. GYB006 TaxID=2994394 RepID=UPI002F96C9D4
MDDKQKEIFTSIFKGTISAIPYVGGGLNELLFEYKSRIAQRRINVFVESFLMHLSTLGLEYDERVIRSDEFIDIYFAVIKRVIETKSEYKLKIYRDILISGLNTDYQSDFKETFLDLVSRLDYIEIEILKLYEKTGREGSTDTNKGFNKCIVSELTSASYKERIFKIIKSEVEHLSTIEIEGRYEFYISDLISKSLLLDKKTISNTYEDMRREGFTMLYITDFGKEFIQFIRYS